MFEKDLSQICFYTIISNLNLGVEEFVYHGPFTRRRARESMIALNQNPAQSPSSGGINHSLK